MEGRCHFAIVNAKTAAPTVCVSQNSLCVTPAVSRATVLGAACRFPLCQTPPKTCFVIGFCLSCWFWLRRIKSLKKWIGLSRNSPVWGQTHQVMKVVQFLLLQLCQKQIKTESKKIFEDFETASSEVRLNSPLSWLHMTKIRVLSQNPSSDCFPLAPLGFYASFVPATCTTGFIRHTFTRYSSLSSRRRLSGTKPNSGSRERCHSAAGNSSDSLS